MPKITMIHLIVISIVREDQSHAHIYHMTNLDARIDLFPCLNKRKRSHQTIQQKTQGENRSDRFRCKCK